MSAEKFKADLDAASRKALVVQKLADIIEWRLGKTHNNQALVNDIVAAGLLTDVPNAVCTHSNTTATVRFPRINADGGRCPECFKKVIRTDGENWQ